VSSYGNLIDVIAALPEKELARLRDRNRRDLERARAEVARLEVQEQQFELAVAKRERRKPGRPGTLTPEVVLEAAGQTDPPMTAADVRATLVAGGLDVTVNAVRNHLNKLAKDGELEKDEAGKFSLPTPVYVPSDFSPPPKDDDIPF
jgi:hypothetical protein